MKKVFFLFIGLFCFLLSLLFEGIIISGNEKNVIRGFMPIVNSNKARYIEGEVILKFVDDRNINSISEISSRYHVKSIEKVFTFMRTEEVSTEVSRQTNELQKIYKIRFHRGFDAKEVAKEYEKNPNVEWAEPNYIFELCQTIPDDKYYTEQWGLEKIQASKAWEIETGSSEIIIAIIDTGVDYNHPDLAGNIIYREKDPPGDVIPLTQDGLEIVRWYDYNNNGIPLHGPNGILNSTLECCNCPTGDDDCEDWALAFMDDDLNGYADDYMGWDFADWDNDPNEDPNCIYRGHGTFCAGISSAVGNNDLGIAGVSWNCKILPIRVYSSVKGELGGETLARGITYSADIGVNVISMSLGISDTEKFHLVKGAIDYAISKNVVCVAAAGNNNSTNVLFPASYSGVISVGATDKEDKKTAFSNYGNVDVMAPGIDIVSTGVDGTYTRASGTSAAAPFVSGLVGLMLSNNPSLSVWEVIQIIKDTADDIDEKNPEYAGLLGSGRINAYNALNYDPNKDLEIISTIPEDWAHYIGSKQSVIIEFNKVIDTTTFAITCLPDPGNWEFIFLNGGKKVIAAHNPFNSGWYEFSVVEAKDLCGNSLSEIHTIHFRIPEYSISGYVRENTNPISGVWVYLEGDAETSVETNSMGYYEITQIPKGGDYRIRPYKSDHLTDPLFREYQDLAGDHTYQNYNANHLEEDKHYISGFIKDINGVIMAGVSVMLTGNMEDNYTTDENGYYRFLNLEGEKDYSITPVLTHYTFNPSEKIYTALSSDHENENYAGILNKWNITGNITQEGNPVSNMSVKLLKNGSYYGLSSVNISGAFIFINLPAGNTYSVIPLKRGYEFTPDIEVFTDLGEDKNVEFSGTRERYSISGYVDENNEGVYGLKIKLTGDENRISYTKSDGDFIKEWGKKGIDNSEFNEPMGVAVDAFTDKTGYVYIVDKNNHRVQKFDSEGNFIFKIGKTDANGNAVSGNGNGEFNLPMGVTVDSSGNIYVADSNNARIQKFDSQGVFIGKWFTFVSILYIPLGITVDSANNLYVTVVAANVDMSPCGVLKYNGQGDALGSRVGNKGNGNGEFNRPIGISVDIEGNIYVVDNLNHRVQKFDSGFVFMDKWGEKGIDNGQFSYPGGIAIDRYGNVYIGDTLNYRVQKFTSAGEYLNEWGGYGSGNGEFNECGGLGISSFDHVYVVDTFNHRIQKFGLNGCYEFLDLKKNMNYTIKPSEPGWSFTPEYREYGNLDSDYDNQNYTGVVNIIISVTSYPESFSPDGDNCNDITTFTLNVRNALKNINNWEFEILDSMSELVKNESGEGELEDHQIIWDGRANEGELVEGGNYYYVLKATDNDENVYSTEPQIVIIDNSDKIVVVNELSSVYENDLYNIQPSWSPVGDTLAFLMSEGYCDWNNIYHISSNAALWEVNISGETPELKLLYDKRIVVPLEPLETNIRQPVYSPCGNYIAFILDNRLNIMNVKTKYYQTVSDFNIDKDAYSFMPTGLAQDIRIVYAEDTGDFGIFPTYIKRLVIADKDGKSVLLSGIAEGDRYVIREIKWSNNGEFIVFSGSNTGTMPDEYSNVYMIKPDGSKLTRLTDDTSNYYNPLISPDSGRIAYIKGDGIDSRICVIHLDENLNVINTVELHDSLEELQDNWTASELIGWSDNSNFIFYYFKKDMLAVSCEPKIEEIRVMSIEHRGYNKTKLMGNLYILPETLTPLSVRSPSLGTGTPQINIENAIAFSRYMNKSAVLSIAKLIYIPPCEEVEGNVPGMITSADGKVSVFIGEESLILPIDTLTIENVELNPDHPAFNMDYIDPVASSVYDIKLLSGQDVLSAMSEMVFKYDDIGDINEDELNVFVYRDKYKRWEYAQPDEYYVTRDPAMKEIRISASHLSLFTLGSGKDVLGPPIIQSVSISPEAISPNGDGIKDKTFINTIINESGTVFVSIFDLMDNKIYEDHAHTKANAYATVVWEGIDELKCIVPDGLYKIKVDAMDLSGEMTNMPYWENVIVDTMPPSAGISFGSPFYVSNGIKYASGETLFSLYAVDLGEYPSGIDYIEYLINYGDMLKYEEAFAISDEGKKIIRYRSVDNAGNKEEIRTFDVSIDNTPPVSELKIDENLSYKTQERIYVNKNAEFTIESIDPVNNDVSSGVSKIYLSIDDSQFNEYSPFKLTEGIRKIDLYAIDNVNNKEDIKSVIVHIDATAPISEIGYEGWVYEAFGQVFISPDTKIVLSANDPEIKDVSSGVFKTYRKISMENEWLDYEGGFTLDVGLHIIYYYSVDNVKNTETVKEKIVIVLPVFEYACFAKEGLSLSGNAKILGDAGCNGDITLTGKSMIDGDARAEGEITLDKLCVITGEIEQGAEPINPAVFDMEMIKEHVMENNDNEKIELEDGKLILENKTMIIPEGTYYIEGMELSGQAKLIIKENVKIFCSGDMLIDAQAELETEGEAPGIMLFYTEGEDGLISISGLGRLNTIIYAPVHNIVIGGNGITLGNVYGNIVEIGGNGVIEGEGYEKIVATMSMLTKSAKSEISLEIEKINVVPNPCGGDCVSQNIEIHLSKEAEIEMKIYNICGDLIYSEREDGIAGNNILIWEGKNTNGQKVSSGVYFVIVEAKNGYEIKRKMTKSAIVK